MKKKSFFISNLAWNKKYQDKIFDLIKKYKIKGIDFAPLQISHSWNDIEKKVKTYSYILKKNNIKVNAVQGIFFKKNLNIFKDSNKIEKILNHIKIIIRICKILNCRKIIVGSSEFRNNHNLKKKEADIIFIQFLKKIIPFLKKEKIFFCLETIPKQYNEKYLYDFNHVISIIKNVNSKWIAINFDTSLFHFKKLNTFKFKKNIDLIKNLQITEKNFKFFLNPSKKNIKFCKELKKNKKVKNISLEIIDNKSDIKKLDLSIKEFVRVTS